MGGGPKRSARIATRKSKRGESPIDEGGNDVPVEAGKSSTAIAEEGNPSTEGDIEIKPISTETPGIATRRKRRIAFKDDVDDSRRSLTPPHEEPETKGSGGKRPREKLVDSVEIVSSKRSRSAMPESSPEANIGSRKLPLVSEDTEPPTISEDATKIKPLQSQTQYPGFDEGEMISSVSDHGPFSDKEPKSSACANASLTSTSVANNHVREQSDNKSSSAKGETICSKNDAINKVSAVKGTGSSTTEDSKANIDSSPSKNTNNPQTSGSNKLLERKLTDSTTHTANLQTLTETKKKGDLALPGGDHLTGSESTDTAGNATNSNACTNPINIEDVPLEADNEDPSIESYSMFELGGSIKTFAATGTGASSHCETKLSVPCLVNASLKLRTMSSFSVGEGSQKNLSWLEDEAKCLLEGESECNIEPLGVHDKLTKIEDETMGKPVDTSINDRAHGPELSIDVHAQIETNRLQTEPDATLPEACSMTETIEVEFPQTNVHKESLSVNQLKMALFLESTKINRGVGAQRAFSNYWESLERHITLSSHASEKHRSRLEIDSVLSVFLATRKMKRLHNKLVLALMSEAMSLKVLARHSLRHVPDQWKDRTSIHAPSSVHSENGNFNDLESDYIQWNALVGKDSGAWTTYGGDITRSKLSNETKTNIHTINNFRKDSAENDSIPSAAIPASIEIDPLVRQHASNSGMLVSENAIWMVTVAMREYMKTVIEKTIANSKELSEGYASQLPRSNIVPLACKQYEAKTECLPIDSRNAYVETISNAVGIIGTAELANMLESNPVIAGSLASSRMLWMRSALFDGTESSLRHLVKMNCSINMAIQQGDSKTTASSVNKSSDTQPLGLLNANVSQTHTSKDEDSIEAPLGSSNTSTPENATKSMQQRSNQSLSKSSSAAVDKQSLGKLVSSPQCKPLTNKPQALHVNGHKCDAVDSNTLVSPPVSDTLNDSSNERKELNHSEPSQTQHNEAAGTLSTPFNGPNIVSSLVVSKEKEARDTSTVV